MGGCLGGNALFVRSGCEHCPLWSISAGPSSSHGELSDDLGHAAESLRRQRPARHMGRWPAAHGRVGQLHGRVPTIWAERGRPNGRRTRAEVRGGRGRCGARALRLYVGLTGRRGCVFDREPGTRIRTKVLDQLRRNRAVTFGLYGTAAVDAFTSQVVSSNVRLASW